jgi:hypothetical protein
MDLNQIIMAYNYCQGSKDSKTLQKSAAKLEKLIYKVTSKLLKDFTLANKDTEDEVNTEEKAA